MPQIDIFAFGLLGFFSLSGFLFTLFNLILITAQIFFFFFFLKPGHKQLERKA